MEFTFSKSKKLITSSILINIIVITEVTGNVYPNFEHAMLFQPEYLRISLGKTTLLFMVNINIFIGNKICCSRITYVLKHDSKIVKPPKKGKKETYK